jgi:acyl-CoA synthetase (AMP-forming)/AMP-acid ligase II
LSKNTLARVPGRYAASGPDAPAIRYQGETYDFAWLETESNRIAQALIAAGVTPGDRVALLDKSAPSFFAVLFGTLKARAVLVPLNYRLAPPELAWIIADAGARVVFAAREFQAGVAPLLGDLDAPPACVGLDGGEPGWPELGEWSAPHPPRDPGLDVRDADALLQMYTSGTTGRPKGVIVNQSGWTAFSAVMNQAPWARHEADDLRLSCMPLYHVAGAYPALVSLEQGGQIVLTREVNPPELVALLKDAGITNTLMAPVVIQFLLQVPGVDAAPYPNLRTISYGASPISEAVLKRAMAVFGCDFVQVYGLTENMGGGTVLDAADHDPALGRLRSCGKPYPGGEARVVDAAGRPLPPGEVGEIQFRAPWTMAGYWQRPQETAAALEGGWLHTGDAGYFDEDGYLFIHDRIKDMIVTGGENVYPAEVENALFGHPAVADAAVIGIPDERWGEAVHAIVVPKPDAAVTEAELVAHARSLIAGYKVPRSVAFADALPRNASGKILKHELRAPYWTDAERGVN